MGVTTLPVLVLRHHDDRERDRVLFCLSRDFGLLRLRARGTKRHAAKLAGSIEPVAEVTLSFADGRASGVLTGAVVAERWPALRQNLVGLVAAQWLAELVERVAKPDHAAPELYDLLRTLWSELAEQTHWTMGRRWLALDRMAWQVLSLEGFAPTFDHCARCARSLSGVDAAFAPHVGIVHADEAQPGAVPLPSAVALYLRDGQVTGDERALFSTLHRFIESLIHLTLDRPLHAERVLRSVAKTERLSSD